MDDLGMESQVVYPTLFLIYLTDDVELEIALCRAYNRFLARAWEQGGGRIRWAVIPPLRDVAATVRAAVRAGAPGRRGLVRALPDLPAALRLRRRLPASVLADLRLLAEGAR
jgi:hypothetical protein